MRTRIAAFVPAAFLVALLAVPLVACDGDQEQGGGPPPQPAPAPRHGAFHNSHTRT